MDNTLQLDDNLQPGMTYVFSFTTDNYFHYPSQATLLADLDAQAPAFVTSPHVSIVSGATRWFNIIFTYQGDGSDVVSDVAAELVSAFAAGSSDNMSFQQASSGTAGVTNVDSTASFVGKEIGTGAGQALGAVTAGVAQGASTGLTSGLGASGWVLILIALLGVLAFFSMQTGIRVRN